MIWVSPRQGTVRCTRVGYWSRIGAGPGVWAPLRRGCWVGVSVTCGPQIRRYFYWSRDALFL